MQIKDPISSFTYCPLCRTKLKVEIYNFLKRKICPDCGFVDFHNPAPACGAVLVKDGKLLLVKRADQPRKDDWCIPAGFMEWDESPEECTVRELKEETGLDIKIKNIFNIYSGTDDPRTNAVLILYFGEIIGGTAKAGDDASDLEFFAKDEIPDNIAFAAHIQAVNDLNEQYPGVLK